MKVEQIYTGCLAQAAYYIESDGEAAIFDPLREVGPYLDRANADKAQIKYVFETHFHADFVSGHLDLAKKTGARIVFGPNANPSYDTLIAEDGQEFTIGRYTIRVLHTPGHTMESTSYLLIDEAGYEHGLISGDTLFIGDVGRPDLAQSLVPGLTQEVLAGHLYDSLRTKIMPLPDHIIVYPSHGAGSACGKKMSKETTDTLGNQKKTNYALRDNMTKEEFIKEVLNGLATPPGYFPENVLLNIQGYESLDTILEHGLRPLAPSEVESIISSTEALLLDTRNAEDFAQGFIPNSINIGLKGSFAQWVGEMIKGVQQEIILITYPGQEEEAVTRLARVGYDHTIGYLDGSIEAWKNAGHTLNTIQRVSVSDLAVNIIEQMPVIDVRKASEYNAEHIKGATNAPLNQINEHLSAFPKETPFVLHCQGGYRSMIAASILKSRGWDNFTEVREGFNGIKKSDIPTTEYICPTTLL